MSTTKPSADKKLSSSEKKETCRPDGCQRPSLLKVDLPQLILHIAYKSKTSRRKMHLFNLHFFHIQSLSYTIAKLNLKIIAYNK